MDKLNLVDELRRAAIRRAVASVDPGLLASLPDPGQAMPLALFVREHPELDAPIWQALDVLYRQCQLLDQMAERLEAAKSEAEWEALLAETWTRAEETLALRRKLQEQEWCSQ